MKIKVMFPEGAALVQKELSDSKVASGNSRCNLSGTAESFSVSKIFSLGRFIFLWADYI